MTNVVGLKCDTATSIAHTPPSEVIDVVLNQLDGDDVDAIVQAGTNLTALDIFWKTVGQTYHSYKCRNYLAYLDHRS